MQLIVNVNVSGISCKLRSQLEDRKSMTSVSLSGNAPPRRPDNHLRTCERCRDERLVCYPAAADEDGGNVKAVGPFYCIPCWHALRCVDAVDAAVALGEMVWCDDENRPYLFGAEGVMVTVLAAGLRHDRSYHHRDVALAMALAKMCTATPVVRWSDLRLCCSGEPGHRWCVVPVSPPIPGHRQRSEFLAEFRVATSEFDWEARSDVTIKAALCHCRTLETQKLRALMALYILGRYDLAAGVEQSCATITMFIETVRVAAACILEDNSLFEANVRGCIISDVGDISIPELLVIHRRTKYIDRLLKDERIEIDLSMLRMAVDRCRGQMDFLAYLLHRAAQVEHGGHVGPNDRPPLTLFRGEFHGFFDEKPLIQCALSEPNAVKLLLEYGASPDVDDVYGETTLQRIGYLMLEAQRKQNQDLVECYQRSKELLLIAAGALVEPPDGLTRDGTS